MALVISTSQRTSVATSFCTAPTSPLTPETPRPARLDPNQVMHVVASDPQLNAPVGPPPPSPPASIKQPDDQMDLHHDRTPSVDSRDTQRALTRSPPSAFPKPTHDLLHRSSTDTRLSTLSAHTGTSSTRVQRTLALSDGTSEVLVAETSSAVSASPSPARHMRNHASSLSQSKSPDGYLQPPPPTAASVPRPSRRNTTGGHIRPVRSAPQAGYAHDVETDIQDDIQLQAEQIRRERKRAKDAEEALGRIVPKRRGSVGKEEGDKVLVGNLIGEDHVNYVLMYNMLTGIRIAVSLVLSMIHVSHRLARCRGARPRLNDHSLTTTLLHDTSIPLTCTHAFHPLRAMPHVVHSIGNELTPSAKYDFKFKDYAPWVFRELREDYFQLDPADYLLSLTAKYILSELGSPGKSGSFFYFSRDYRFIIKTIRHSEHKFLLSILKRYHAHVKNNPHTLLSRFYGLHRVKLPRGHKIHFVIMNNLFPPHKDIHETYDLKGSTVGREYPEDKAKKNPRAVLKDLNWINRGKMLELGPEKRALLTEQLRRDSEFLKTVYVMDYSLLVGIHLVQRGNRDKVRSNTLKVFSVSDGSSLARCLC